MKYAPPQGVALAYGIGVMVMMSAFILGWSKVLQPRKQDDEIKTG